MDLETDGTKIIILGKLAVQNIGLWKLAGQKEALKETGSTQIFKELVGQK